MAKSSRFKRRRKVSKNHKKMREVLHELFPNFPIYEEYPYSKILQIGYKKYNVPENEKHIFLQKRCGKLKADFCIPKLCIIIEVQGEHHYGIVNYNGDIDLAECRYQNRLHLDGVKRLAAKEANFFLIEWKYDLDINVENLKESLTKIA